MGYTVYYTTYTIYRYFYLNKIKSIQTLRSQNDKAIFRQNRMAARATFFCFIFRVRGRILMSVKDEWKNRNLLSVYCADAFHFGKKNI